MTSHFWLISGRKSEDKNVKTVDVNIMENDEGGSDEERDEDEPMEELDEEWIRIDKLKELSLPTG